MLAAVDISGRGQLHWDVDVPLCLLGAFDTSLAKEFFIAFATNAQVTLHVRMVVGENAHHIVEACFKAVGRAMCQALEINRVLQASFPPPRALCRKPGAQSPFSDLLPERLKATDDCRC